MPPAPLLRQRIGAGRWVRPPAPPELLRILVFALCLVATLGAASVTQTQTRSQTQSSSRTASQTRSPSVTRMITASLTTSRSPSQTQSRTRNSATQSPSYTTAIAPHLLFDNTDDQNAFVDRSTSTIVSPSNWLGLTFYFNPNADPDCGPFPYALNRFNFLLTADATGVNAAVDFTAMLYWADPVTYLPTSLRSSITSVRRRPC